MDGHRQNRKTPNMSIPESPKPQPSSSKLNLNRSSTPASISKARTKTRRTSARRHAKPSPGDSRRTDSFRPDSADMDEAGPILVFDSNSRPRDPDLSDILARLEGHEQRICLILGNMHNEMNKCSNFMLECISIHLKKVIDAEKRKIPKIEKLRETQRAANVHLNELRGGKR